MPFGIESSYRLRWRYDFADGKTRWGIWNDSGAKAADSAWANNREGLIRASIESESQTTWAVETVVECDGHDFVEFRWLAAAAISPLGFSGSVTIPGAIVGLELITREKRASAIVNGKLLIRERTAEEKASNLEQYRK